MSGLPSGWTASPLHALVTLNPKNEANGPADAAFMPMQYLGTSFRHRPQFQVRPWGEIVKSYVHFAEGDVLLAKITPCFENGKAGIPRGLPSGIGAGSSEYFVCRPDAEVLMPEWLLAYFKTSDFLRNGAREMTGSVGHKRVPKDYLLNVDLPLPPIAEQQRIADKLDAILARVDACRDRLDRVGPLLQRFRQSVLSQASTGELTQAWRSERPTPDAAQEVEQRLRKLVALSKKAVETPDLTFWDRELPPSWRLCSVAQFAECLDRLRVPVKREHRSAKQGLYPYYGANGEVSRIDEFIFDDELVLVTEDETFYGRTKPIAYRSSGRCWVNNHAHVLRPFSKLEADYLCIVLMHYNVLPWLTGTTGRAKLTKQALLSLPIAVPPLAEMAEIVDRVNRMLRLADALGTRLTMAQAQASKLPAATLAKAFRGELVPQDANDEPAAEMLARLATSTAPKKIAKRGRSTA